MIENRTMKMTRDLLQTEERQRTLEKMVFRQYQLRLPVLKPAYAYKASRKEEKEFKSI